MAKNNKNPFNFAYFKGPKFSAVSNTHGNRTTMKFGELVPIYWEFLNANDRISDTVSHLVRVAPMLFPVMEDIEINLDAFAVPVDATAVAYRNPYIYRDFFNLNKNIDGSLTIPETPTAGGDNIGNLIEEMSLTGFKGTLWDYMGMPTFPNYRKAFRQALNNQGLFTYFPVDTDFVTTTASWGNSQVGYPVDIGNAGRTIKIADVLWNSDFSNVDVLNGFRRIDSSTSNDYAATYPMFWYWLMVKYPVGLRVLSWGNQGGSVVDRSFSSGYHPDMWLGRVPTSSAQRFPLAPITYQTSSSITSAVGAYAYVGFEGTFSSYDAIAKADQRYYVASSLLADDTGRSFYDKVFEIYHRDISSLQEEYFNEMLYLNLKYGLRTGLAGNVTNMTSNLTDYITSYLDNAVTDSADVPEVGNFDQQTKLDRLGAVPYYPFDCYWKIVSDWYLNTSFDDPEEWYLDKILGANNSDPYDRVANHQVLFGKPFMRNWKNDYFTSAFPSPQVGQGVTISDGDSIVDLRNKNTWQKIKEKLLYAGKRFRDVWYAMTGIKVGLHEADMSIPIASYHGHINVSSILQTSESTSSSPQAQYAGTGISANGNSLHFDYVADSPTVIMVLASIRPRASYYQGIHRKLLRNNVYEYDWSDFSNIGEQPIYNYEIFADAPSRQSRANRQASDVFGWTRRFADFMFTPNEVHGDMVDTYDFMHLARQFDDVPALGQNFVAVNAEDDNLNRIFADTSDSLDKFFCHFVFDGAVVRAIPKFIKYDL